MSAPKRVRLAEDVIDNADDGSGSEQGDAVGVKMDPAALEVLSSYYERLQQNSMELEKKVVLVNKEHFGQSTKPLLDERDKKLAEAAPAFWKDLVRVCLC